MVSILPDIRYCLYTLGLLWASWSLPAQTAGPGIHDTQWIFQGVSCQYEDLQPPIPPDTELLFNENQSMEIFANGDFNRAYWYQKRDTLFFPFFRREAFRIQKLTASTLTLSFLASDGYYPNCQILFHNSLNPPPTPVRPPVQTTAKSQPTQPSERIMPPIQSDTEIKIELIGGQTYEAADGVLQDYILIKPNGRLIHEYQSRNSYSFKRKRDLDGQELYALADYIRKQGFFSFDDHYPCRTSACRAWQLDGPSPIPLRLAVTIGTYRKVVQVDVWGLQRGGTPWIDYPEALNDIVDAVRYLSETAE